MRLCKALLGPVLKQTGTVLADSQSRKRYAGVPAAGEPSMQVIALLYFCLAGPMYNMSLVLRGSSLHNAHGRAERDGGRQGLTPGKYSRLGTMT